MTNEQRIALKRYANIELAKRDLFHFCKVIDSKTFYDEKVAPYLKEICDAIQEFENDDNEALIINMPPRHGKTRTINNAVAWLLGHHPYKIMEGAYNRDLSRLSSQVVRDKIGSVSLDNRIVYNDIFPNTKLKQGSTSVDCWGLENCNEKNYLATSPKGTSTGMGADFIVIDDTIKGLYEAYHKEILRQIFEDWFSNTLYQRLEGKRKVIIVMTRWATRDIAGRLMQMMDEQGRKYRLITKKAYNPETQKMLNDTVLNKKQYDLLIKTVGEDIVRANYDQEPIDLKGKLYTHFLTYMTQDLKTPNNPDGKIVLKDIRAIADTADMGTDYLCMIIYGIGLDKKIYVLDIYYTQDHMEVTEKEAANRLFKHNPSVFKPESNNGGRGWGRNVEMYYKQLGGTRTIFKPYTQTLNKEARILSNATEVMNEIYYPNDWNIKYRDYYNSMNEYQRQGKNEHDDAEDCTTAIIEDVFNKIGARYA